MTQTALHTESWSIRKSTCASSRRINGFAEHNVQAVAFCENQASDFIVIADFVSGMADEIKQVFINILLIVDQMNLPGNTVFALDGCKLLSNAGKEQTGRSDTLSRSSTKSILLTDAKYILDAWVSSNLFLQISALGNGLIISRRAHRRRLLSNGCSTASFIIWQKSRTSDRHYRRLRYTGNGKWCSFYLKLFQNRILSFSGNCPFF